MKQRLGSFALALAVLTIISLVVLAPKPVTAQGPADQGPTVDQGAETEAGLFGYSGGFVRGKRARTQTSGLFMGEPVGFVSIPNAFVQWTVPAATTDLFNVSFSAECRLYNGLPGDAVIIRVLDNGVPMEPYDGGQAFCSDNNFATHKGNWVKRLGQGLHTIQVQIRVFDAAPLTALNAWIDDWTLELVVYD